MKIFTALLFAAALTGCSAKMVPSSGNACTPYSNSGAALDTGNTMAVTVGCGYINEPCVQVKVCEPGTTNCAVIDHILLDTGSYGLRLFNCTNSLNLPAQTDALGRSLGECVSYADNSVDWGPVVTADVYLADQKASSVPVQIIDPNYSGGKPSDCAPLSTQAAEYSPTASGFNGILGVGLLQGDCPSCLTDASGSYYSCTGSSCADETTLSSTLQVNNPVSWLSSSSYNNGTILSLNSIGSSGSSSATGTLTLGISSTSTVTVSSADSSAEFSADYGGTTCGGAGSFNYTHSFVDSGSNFWDFPDASDGAPYISECSDGFYCPSPDKTITAWAGSGSGCGGATTVSFTLTYADNIVYNGNTAFDNVGAPFDSGTQSSDGFDFGLPFFYGKSVYSCIKGKTCGTYTGPFWAW